MYETAHAFADIISHPSLISGATKRPYSLNDALVDQQLAEYPVVLMNQVHQDSCRYIDSQIPSQMIPETDAMFTDQPNIVLTVKMADCLPILVFHPKPVIAVMHAGRKGTELEISAKTLLKIQATFNLDDQFTCWLGPCICESCYQIDPIADIHYDLIAKNKRQLLSTGLVHPNQILESHLCTACRHDLFFSYRKGDQKARNFAFMMLKKDL